MIIYLRILSHETEAFVKEIAIDNTQTFIDLHNTIQELLQYDATQMASFFTTDKEWNKEMEITLFDMADSGSDRLRVMQDTVLSDYLFKEKQRLLYVFDFFSERCFFMELIQIAEGTLNKPHCYRNEGQAPQQILVGDLSGDTKRQTMNLYDDVFEDSGDLLDFDNSYDLDIDNELSLHELTDRY